VVVVVDEETAGVTGVSTVVVRVVEVVAGSSRCTLTQPVVAMA
jgi:hypothetical protein